MRYIVSILNLHDFRYEGGAPINSGFQIPLVIEKKEYGSSQQARAIWLNWYRLTNNAWTPSNTWDSTYIRKVIIKSRQRREWK